MKPHWSNFLLGLAQAAITGLLGILGGQQKRRR